jgi:hypothetical protein
LVTVTMVGMAATAVARLGAFDPLTEGIRNLHDSGNPANMRTPLATLAALLDRLERYEPVARIAGFALSPLTSASVPETTTAIAHLRDALGDQTYDDRSRRDVRIRPNRPGPSRIERSLAIDELRESRKSVAIGRVELGSV